MRRTLTFTEEDEIRTALGNAHDAIARAWHMRSNHADRDVQLAAAIGAVSRASVILQDPTYLGRENAARINRENGVG